MRSFVNRVSIAAAVFTALTFGLTPAVEAHSFKIIGSGDQTQQIERSLAACPSLITKLDILKKLAGFTQIRVTTSDETKRNGPFLATVSGREIIVAADWLLQQNQPYFDVRHEGEILPDNLCFDLGHLSDHVEHPVSQTPTGIDLNAWVDQRLKAESRAFLRAWPYVLEAARAKNGGKSLSARQISDLLINLRYRFAFLGAMDAKANPRISILDNGNIPESDANVAAIVAVLPRSAIADLQ